MKAIIKTAKLKDVCKIEKGKIGITKAIEGEYPLVVTAEERGSHNEWHFDEPATIVPLVSSTGHGHASIKRLHYAEGKYAVGSILATLIPKDHDYLNAKYLYVYLTVNKEELLVSKMTGAANVSLTLTNLKEVEVEIPNYETQLRVIKTYEQSERFKTKMLNQIEFRSQNIENLRQQILQDAISGKLSKKWREENPNVESAEILLEKVRAEKEKLVKGGKIRKQKDLPLIQEDEIPFDLPKGWAWSRLGDVIELTSGQHIQASDHNRKGIGTPYITGPSDFVSDREISITSWTNSPKVVAKEGDILITVKGSGVGKLSEVSVQEVCISRQLMAIQSEYQHRDYIKYFLSCNYSYFQNVKKGVGIPGISRKIIQEYIIALPPIKEQEYIVQKVDLLTTKLASIDQNNFEDLQSLL